MFSHHSPCGVFPDGESALMLVCATKAYRHEGMGLQEVPEYDTLLREKGKRAETETGKYQKEGRCSLDLMKEQTLRYFCEKNLTQPFIWMFLLYRM